jgi:hypothetical protein
MWVLQEFYNTWENSIFSFFLFFLLYKLKCLLLGYLLSVSPKQLLQALCHLNISIRCYSIYQVCSWQLLYPFFLGGGFRDSVSLYSSGCPGTHSVDQAGLELRNPPASASRVLGLKVCAIMPACRTFYD